MSFSSTEYKYGFVTPIESEVFPKGLNEEIVRAISAKKNEPEFLLQFRLKAFRKWQQMTEPSWANVKYPPLNYQDISYYAEPKNKPRLESLDQVDPEILRTLEKLGIPLDEQKRLTNVAVDVVFDSVSLGTTFRRQLEEAGVVLCSISEAVQRYPELIEEYLGSVVPIGDNFFAALNSAVFSDGSFVYVPKGVRSPMELSTYFRINEKETGQFERTLIIAEEGAYVSYLEGCLPRSEEIFTGYQCKPIVDVAIRDFIVNEKGEHDRVAKIMKRRYKGHLIQVEPRSPGNRFELTPEHPVLCIPRKAIAGASRGEHRWPDILPKKLAITEPQYIKAGDLQPGDLLVYPIVQTEHDDSSLSDAFLRLLGYYVAEGCATKFNGCDALEFSLGLHEKHLIADVVTLVQKVIGKTPSVTYDHKRNGAYIVVYSKHWCEEFVKHGGKYADSKSLSTILMELPAVRQKLFLETYYLGDGSVCQERNFIRVRATTVSRNLAFQLQALWARQGTFAYINVRAPFAETMKDGRIISHKQKYTIYYSQNTKGRRAIRKDDYFLVPIRRIEKVPFDDFVYNFETKNEPHSYLVKGFAVHNCTAPAFDTKQLHAAVVELVAKKGAEIKYSTVQNWYAGNPKTGAGGVYNFVTKRGLCLGERSKISWTQVEAGAAITWKYPSCILRGDHSVGEFYSVALTNGHMQADTGTKMIHIGKNTSSTIISKGISADKSHNSYRGQVKILSRAEGARNYTQCDSMLVGNQCSANTFPYIEVENQTASVEHEASTSKMNEEQIFYLQTRGLSKEEAIQMIVNGFCKEVIRELPLEFAAEAQKLLTLKLENSVG